MIRLLILAATLIPALGLSGATPTLVNGGLQLGDGGKLSGWKVVPATVELTNIPVEGQEDVESALSLEVTDVNQGNGQILQRIALKNPGGKLRVAGLVRSSIPRAAYLEVKLYAAKKELSRTRGEASAKGWKTTAVEVDTTGATHIEVLCRWFRQEKFKGARVDFAQIGFTAVDKTIGIAGGPVAAEQWPGRPKRGWGQYLSDYLLDTVGVANLAGNGQTVRTFREEGHWKKALSAKPDVLLIQFGLLESIADQPQHLDPGTFSGLLRQCLEEARAQGIQPVLVTPPATRRFRDGRLDPGLEPYETAIRELAGVTETPLIDLYTPSADLLRQRGETGSVPLFCSFKDRNHYSAEGARWLAGQATTGLVAALPETRSHVRPEALAASKQP